MGTDMENVAPPLIVGPTRSLHVTGSWTVKTPYPRDGFKNAILVSLVFEGIAVFPVALGVDCTA
jgi:hypothetical protein